MKRVLFIFCLVVLPKAFFAQVALAEKIDSNKSKTEASLSTKLIGDKSSKEPIHISSDTLTLKSDQRIFVYKGNVKVVQGDMTLLAEELQGLYDENNQIQELIAKRNVLITKGANIRATSQKAVYTASNEIVTLTENPKLEQDKSILMADIIRVSLRDNKSTAEGNVQVTVVKAEATPTAMPTVSP